MTELSAFMRYYEQAELLIRRSGKEQLGACLRTLALDLAYLHERYGETRYCVHAEMELGEPDAKEARILTNGMRLLVEMLGGPENRQTKMRH